MRDRMARSRGSATSLTNLSWGEDACLEYQPIESENSALYIRADRTAFSNKKRHRTSQTKHPPERREVVFTQERRRVALTVSPGAMRARWAMSIKTKPTIKSSTCASKLRPIIME